MSVIRFAEISAVAAVAALSLGSPGGTQKRPSPQASTAARDDDIVVKVKRMRLADGEWVVEVTPPIVIGGHGDTTPSNDPPTVKRWRFCLRGGDAYRMVTQLAQVGGRRNGQHCGQLRMGLNGNRFTGTQHCRELVNDPTPTMTSSPLGTFTTSEVTVDGSYKPDGFDFAYRTVIQGSPDRSKSLPHRFGAVNMPDDGVENPSGDQTDDTGSMTDDLTSDTAETRFSVVGRRMGECPVQPRTAAAPGAQSAGSPKP